MGKTIVALLCEGRHEVGIPYDGVLFPQVVESPLDFPHLEELATARLQALGALNAGVVLHVIVTGLTPVLTATLNAVRRSGLSIKVVLYHFNRDTGGYEPQEMV